MQNAKIDFIGRLLAQAWFARDMALQKGCCFSTLSVWRRLVYPEWQKQNGPDD
jgi:hypothetical protein